MFYSRKIGNLLFGKHSIANNNDCLNVRNKLMYPDEGAFIEWPGNDGLIYTLVKRINILEADVARLKNAQASLVQQQDAGLQNRKR